MYAFFRLPITAAITSAIRVALTPFSGDADLYASFHVSRPDSRHYNFSSMSAGLSTDVLRFGSGNLCPRRPCTLSISLAQMSPCLVVALGRHPAEKSRHYK